MSTKNNLGPLQTTFQANCLQKCQKMSCAKLQTYIKNKIFRRKITSAARYTNPPFRFSFIKLQSSKCSLEQEKVLEVHNQAHFCLLWNCVPKSEPLSSHELVRGRHVQTWFSANSTLGPLTPRKIHHKWHTAANSPFSLYGSLHSHLSEVSIL